MPPPQRIKLPPQDAGARRRHRRRSLAPAARPRRSDRFGDPPAPSRRHQGADGAAPRARPEDRARHARPRAWSPPLCRWSTAGRGGWSTACSARCCARASPCPTRRACRRRSRSAGARPGARRWCMAARRAIAQRPPLDLSFASDEAAQAYAEPAAFRSRRAIAGSSMPAMSPSCRASASGGWWVQDLAASLPARLIPADASDVLDLCAAPGGKTMQLAAAGHRRDRASTARKVVWHDWPTISRAPDLQAELVAADALDWAPPNAVRRHPARRALLGDRHLPPPSRSALPRPARDHRRERRAAGPPARPRRRHGSGRAAPWSMRSARSSRRKARSVVDAFLAPAPGFAIDPPRPASCPTA